MKIVLLKKGATKIESVYSIENLKKSLEDLGEIPSYTDKKVFDYAVNFFNVITLFQDNAIINEQSFKATPEEIKSIKRTIQESGRHQYGWVRAKKGEPVTLDNLYLGDVYGIWTKTAREFKNSESDFGDKNMLKNPDLKIKTREIIANEQLIPFIKLHRQNLINLAGKVLNKNKNPKTLINLSGHKINKDRGSR